MIFRRLADSGSLTTMTPRELKSVAVDDALNVLEVLVTSDAKMDQKQLSHAIHVLGYVSGLSEQRIKEIRPIILDAKKRHLKGDALRQILVKLRPKDVG
jgi:hypothetical protein